MTCRVFCWLWITRYFNVVKKWNLAHSSFAPELRPREQAGAIIICERSPITSSLFSRLVMIFYGMLKMVVWLSSLSTVVSEWEDSNPGWSFSVCSLHVLSVQECFFFGFLIILKKHQHISHEMIGYLPLKASLYLIATGYCVNHVVSLSHWDLVRIKVCLFFLWLSAKTVTNFRVAFRLFKPNFFWFTFNVEFCNWATG